MTPPQTPTEVLAHADAAEKRSDEDRLAVLRAAFDLSAYAEVSTWADRFRPRMNSEARAEACSPKVVLEQSKHYPERHQAP